jgi:hypothetical protein
MKSENMNTEKIAKAMAEVMDAKFVGADEITLEELSEYDFISFSPGIYAFNHNKDMIGFMEEKDLQKEGLCIIHIK